jgi:DNA-binding transcriptional LysR family regulator
MPLPPWTPDLPALDLFLSVAELGSIGRAAAAHGLSQPSVSARLARLERQLGVDILVRTPRGSVLTPAGEAVVAWARTIVDGARVLTDGAVALRADLNARLRVAASLTVAEYLLPLWLLSLRRNHVEELDIAATVGNSQLVCDWVRSGAADVGFVEMPTVPPDLSARAVGTDRLVLAVAPGHPYVEPGPTAMTPQDLLRLPLLVREPGSGTRDTFLHALSAALGQDVHDLAHATELGSTTTIVATARAGGGVAVVSARAVAGDFATGTLTELEVAGLSMIRPLHAIWRGSRLTNLAHELVLVARD